VKIYDNKTCLAAEAMTTRQLGRGLKNSDFVVKSVFLYFLVLILVTLGSGPSPGWAMLGGLSAAPLAYAINQYREKLNNEWRDVYERNVRDIEPNPEEI
jgi:hypothetical protein